jgi:hypothetical protein
MPSVVWKGICQALFFLPGVNNDFKSHSHTRVIKAELIPFGQMQIKRPVTRGIVLASMQ